MKVYDRFTDEYIDESEMEEIAPPERYVAITEEVLINNASRWFTEAFKQNDKGEEWTTNPLIERRNQTSNVSIADIGIGSGVYAL